MKLISCLLIALSFSLSFQTSALAQSYDVQAGPIWNNNDAKRKCPFICRNNRLEWKGQWRTTVWGKMSVCGCDVPKRLPAQVPLQQLPQPPAAPGQSATTFDLKAGPIWNNNDARRKCPFICRNNELEWTGQWRTTVPGKMSVCGCKEDE